MHGLINNTSYFPCCRMSDFLVDCAEHIIVLTKVHRRVMNRYFKFCLWLGIPYHRVQATKPNELCRIVSEFALEYRTTRERVMQQLEKKASHRERNKTRGKMITEVVFKDILTFLRLIVLTEKYEHLKKLFYPR